MSGIYLGFRLLFQYSVVHERKVSCHVSPGFHGNCLIPFPSHPTHAPHWRDSTRSRRPRRDLCKYHPAAGSVCAHTAGSSSIWSVSHQPAKRRRGRKKKYPCLRASRPIRMPGLVPETLYHRGDALLYIAYVMLIWAAPIPADRWHCSLGP